MYHSRLSIENRCCTRYFKWEWIFFLLENQRLTNSLHSLKEWNLTWVSKRDPKNTPNPEGGYHLWATSRVLQHPKLAITAIPIADTYRLEKVNLYLHTREGEVRSRTSFTRAAVAFPAPQEAEHETAAAEKLHVPSVHFQRQPKERRKNWLLAQLCLQISGKYIQYIFTFRMLQIKKSNKCSLRLSF